eukprot:TRINITY_DN13648_c0_g2_i2.p1 TRINITY_DN13648_c0_g2~~TRINITY_DN13648_c0_g2_i2.p1  ORF type:complete len:603 (+),score=181.25 TRINITY_DN13648_c0_g2_i2:44-1852(+)
MYGYLKVKVNMLQWRNQFATLDEKKKTLKYGDSPCGKVHKIIRVSGCDIQLEKADTDFSVTEGDGVAHVFRAPAPEACGMWLANIKMVKQGLDPGQLMGMARKVRFNLQLVLPHSALQKLAAVEEQETIERRRIEGIAEHVRFEISMELSDAVYLTSRTEKKVRLADMGFSPQQAGDALVKTSGNFDAAVEVLVNAEDLSSIEGLVAQVIKLIRIGYRAEESEAAINMCQGNFEAAVAALKEATSKRPRPPSPPPSLIPNMTPALSPNGSPTSALKQPKRVEDPGSPFFVDDLSTELNQAPEALHFDPASPATPASPSKLNHAQFNVRVSNLNNVLNKRDATQSKVVTAENGGLANEAATTAEAVSPMEVVFTETAMDTEDMAEAVAHREVNRLPKEEATKNVSEEESADESVVEEAEKVEEATKNVSEEESADESVVEEAEKVEEQEATEEVKNVVEETEKIVEEEPIKTESNATLEEKPAEEEANPAVSAVEETEEETTEAKIVTEEKTAEETKRVEEVEIIAAEEAEEETAEVEENEAAESERQTAIEKQKAGEEQEPQLESAADVTPKEAERAAENLKEVAQEEAEEELKRASEEDSA